MFRWALSHPLSLSLPTYLTMNLFLELSCVLSHSLYFMTDLLTYPSCTRRLSRIHRGDLDRERHSRKKPTSEEPCNATEMIRRSPASIPAALLCSATWILLIPLLQGGRPKKRHFSRSSLHVHICAVKDKTKFLVIYCLCFEMVNSITNVVPACKRNE